jgi:hypothetical protein
MSGELERFQVSSGVFRNLLRTVMEKAVSGVKGQLATKFTATT